MTYQEFEKSLEHVAERMDIPLEKVHEKVLACQGPVFSGTKVFLIRLKKLNYMMINRNIQEFIKEEDLLLLINPIWV